MLSSIFSYCLANSRQLKSQNTEEFTKSIAAYAVIVKNKQPTPAPKTCVDVRKWIHSFVIWGERGGNEM